MLSRVADSLYWMSRYLERAEHSARLIDVHLNVSLEAMPGQATLWRWARSAHHIEVDDFPQFQGDYHLMHALAFDMDNDQSIVCSITLARENARQIREQISSELWVHINRMYLDIRNTNMDEVWNAQPHEFFRSVREGSHLFQGITDATMYRNEGWYFIQLGRFIERAMSIIGLMDVQFANVIPSLDHRFTTDEYFEWVGFLKFFTAFEAFCKVYDADLRAYRVANFLLLNPEFPHAIRFCVEMIQEALDAITVETGLARNLRLHRQIGRLRSDLSFVEIDDVVEHFHEYLGTIYKQLSMVHEGVYETFIYRPIEPSF